MNHKRTIAILSLVFLVALSIIMLAGCGAGPHAVLHGKLRDTIFAVEPKVNGSFLVWMRFDDVGVYCTMNEQLIAEINEIFEDEDHEPYIFMVYSSLNVGSQENPALDIFSTQGCKHDAATIYVIESVTRIVPNNQITR